MGKKLQHLEFLAEASKGIKKTARKRPSDAIVSVARNVREIYGFVEGVRQVVGLVIDDIEVMNFPDGYESDEVIDLSED